MFEVSFKKLIYIALVLGLILTMILYSIPIFPKGGFYEIYTFSLIVIYLILKELEQ